MSSEKTTGISTALTKKLLFADQPDQKISNEALEAASFLLCQFIAEARSRASIEVSFRITNRDSSIGFIPSFHWFLLLLTYSIVSWSRLSLI